MLFRHTRTYTAIVTTGSVANASTLLSQIMSHFNDSLAEIPPSFTHRGRAAKSHVLLQYFDIDVGAFVDLVDGDDELWQVYVCVE